MYSMSISMSYLYHILYNTLIFNMVYFRGGEVISLADEEPLIDALLSLKRVVKLIYN